MSKNIKDIIANSSGREKESVTEFLWELVSCWLLSAGTCLLIDVQFPMRAGLLPILWQTLLTLVITALLTRRWWITLSSVGLAVAGTFLWLALSEHSQAYLTTAWDFFQWWLSNLPQDSPWYSAESLSIVHGLIHIGVSVFLFLLMRSTRRAWPALLLCAGMQILILAVGDTSNNAPAMAAYLAGLFPLLARDQYSGRRLFSRKNKFRLLGARWLVATASGVLCIAVAAGMLFLLPSDTRDIRTRWCSQISSDLQSVTGWYTGEQRQVITLTLHDLGLQPSIFRIGGNLKEQEPTLLATVEADSPVLMRVTSFDTFTGTLWTNEFENSYRVDSHWKIQQSQALASPILEDENWKPRLLELLQPQDVTVTLKTATPFLLTLGHTLGITENTRTKNPLQFNSKGQVFSYFTMPEEYSYTLQTLSYPTRQPLTDQQYILLQAASSVGEDPLYDDENFYAHYINLPDDYSLAAADLASDLTGDITTAYEKAYVLSRYFTTNRGYVYTDKPGRIGKSENVVDKLLETKKGHCIYYATAMATMTRAIGIPSRLVAGYRTAGTDTDGVQAVVASRPYAWVECYIRNLGWIAFDPTPSQQIAAKPQSPTPPPDAEEPEQEDPEEEVQPPEEEEKEEEPIHKKFVLPTEAVPVIILLLALLLVVLRTLLIHRAYDPQRVKKRYPSTRQQVEFYYQDILRQLACLGYRLQPGETLGELTARLQQPLDEETVAAVQQAVTVIHTMHYGAGTPTEEQADQLAALWQTLDAATRQHMLRPRFILRRRMLLPYFSQVVRRYR